MLEQPARRVPGLQDLAAVDRACTVRFLKISDSATSIVDRPRRDPEQDDVAAVPDDPERVLDRAQRAGHLEDDVDADPLVLLEEPRRHVVAPRRRSRRRRRPSSARARAGTGRGRRRTSRPAPNAFAIAIVNSPTGPQPSTATARPARSCVDVAKTALPNGSWRRRDLGRKLRAVVAPDDRRGHGDVVGEAAVAVDAEDLRLLAHVRLARAAVEAHAAGDVALGRDVVALGDVADRAPGRDDRPAELVAERERRLDPLRRPLVPALDVQVGSADARRLDPDEHLVRRRASGRAPPRA